MSGSTAPLQLPLGIRDDESDSDRVEEGYTDADDAVEALLGMASMHASVSDA